MDDHADHAPPHNLPEHPRDHTGQALPDKRQAGHAGHDTHAGHTPDMFKRPFWISLLLTIPIVVYSDMIQMLVGYRAPAFPGSGYVGLLLGSVVFWYGGHVFLSGAVGEIRRRMPGMMTLVALAISTAYVYSIAISAGVVAGMDFYWELATLVTIMLLGHWLEMRAVGSAQSALNELAKLLPDPAERLDADGHSETVAVAALHADDLVLIRPGAAIPADGTVEQGDSQLNESMITGESRPVDKHPGEAVIAGTVNGSGALRVRIDKIGEQTALAGIMRLVAEAQNSRSLAQDLANRAAFWLTWIALGTAVLTALVWGFAEGLTATTLERVVTVLVVACPHALGLAIPLVIAISTSLSARSGILVRDRRAIEEARRVDTVMFDKTGTLTKGELGLVGLATNGAQDADTVLAFAAAVERDSEHLLARAIVAAAEARGLALPEVHHFQALPGRGVAAQIGRETYQVGGPHLLEQAGVELPAALAAQSVQWRRNGQTVVYLLRGREVLAALALADLIRPESRQAVQELQAQGIAVVMLTGDSQDVAAWVAGELGITTVFAQVLPEYKAARVQELQRQGRRVAMVGDGVNDAPALAQADVGIAIGAGTDVARAAAGIVLVGNDPRGITRIVRLSRASYRKMVQNLVWAVGYNVIALPLAAGVAAPLGLVLPMWIGAVLMSLSTIIVALNAQLLRRFH
ncbi:MAG TPA: heavy metal translocating P-type ATPase [Roseiflexaceae bacterium]|nr:heavy metal translocating P-type ATPase [Roseiflexaceae bacterium]